MRIPVLLVLILMLGEMTFAQSRSESPDYKPTAREMAERLKRIEAAEATRKTSPSNVNVTEVKTNINCETGKKKVEEALSQDMNLNNVKINIHTGTIKVSLSDQSRYDHLIKIINDLGFNVDQYMADPARAEKACK